MIQPLPALPVRLQEFSTSPARRPASDTGERLNRVLRLLGLLFALQERTVPLVSHFPKGARGTRARGERESQFRTRESSIGYGWSELSVKIRWVRRA